MYLMMYRYQGQETDTNCFGMLETRGDRAYKKGHLVRIIGIREQYWTLDVSRFRS